MLQTISNPITKTYPDMRQQSEINAGFSLPAPPRRVPCLRICNGKSELAWYESLIFILDKRTNGTAERVVTAYEWIHEVHPAILSILKPTVLQSGWYTAITTKYRPKDRNLLALEQPRIPDDKDAQRVAYWQSDAKQARNLATVTSLGKYLKRHYPDLPDNIIRDMVALQAPLKFSFVETTDEIVESIQKGPASCMKWESGDAGIAEEDFDSGNYAHPYECYAPELGWKMCVGTLVDQVVARAMVLDTACHKVFVRTYGKNKAGDGIEASAEMSAFLKEKGYTHRSRGWPEGTRIRKISAIEDQENHEGYVFPYIDGNEEQSILSSYCQRTWQTDTNGEIKCRNTDGGAEEVEKENMTMCEDCESECSEDDTYWVEDRCVCPSCFEANYVSAIGCGGNLVSMAKDDCVEVNGKWYVIEYINENDIIELYDGKCVGIDDCVYVEGAEEYYHVDDVDDSPESRDSTSLVIQRLNGSYYLRADSEWCVYNEAWYGDSETTKLNGNKEHVTDVSYVLTENLSDYLVTLTLEEAKASVNESTYARFLQSSEYTEAAENEAEDMGFGKQLEIENAL